jgi:hypothetical protein
MLFSNMPTMTALGYPLKSGGEFFIKAMATNSALILASGQKITINQPASLTGGVDSLNRQLPFILGVDTTGFHSDFGWIPTIYDSVDNIANKYVFSMYQFNSPVEAGSWCNSDNSSYFSAYTQTTLTLVPNDNFNTYSTDVFLIFKNTSSMVHVYYDYINSFPYTYAPQGLQCTLVAIGIKNGILYSSFVPITISSNLSVHFSLSPTTTSAFTSQLKALN